MADIKEDWEFVGGCTRAITNEIRHPSQSVYERVYTKRRLPSMVCRVD